MKIVFPQVNNRRVKKKNFLDESAVYITGDGSVFSATEVTDIFGSAAAVQDIEDGEIKVKYGVGSSAGDGTGSLLEPRVIRDTLLESSRTSNTK